MKVAAIRIYENTRYGLRTAGEVWAPNVDETLSRLLPIPKKEEAEKAWEKLKDIDIEDIRILAYTQPKLVKGVPKKKPELMELRIGGGSMDKRMEYAKSILGKDITVTDFAKDGDDDRRRRDHQGEGIPGSDQALGNEAAVPQEQQAPPHGRYPWRRRGPGTSGPTVPQAGQMGYHQRTEINKRVLKIGTKGEEINPKGGFVHYGQVVNHYVLIHGSVPGPTKRLVRLRDPVRNELAPS